MLAKKEEEVKKVAERLDDWKGKVQAPPKDSRYKTAVLSCFSQTLGCYQHKRLVLGLPLFKAAGANGTL